MSGYLRLAREGRLPRVVVSTVPTKQGMLVLPRRDDVWRMISWMMQPEEDHLLVYACDLRADAPAVVPLDYLKVHYPLVKPLDQVSLIAKNGHTSEFDTAELAWILHQFGEAAAADAMDQYARPPPAERRRATREGQREPPAVRVTTLNPPQTQPTAEAVPASVREYHHRWEVRGRWGNQPCGPQRSQRRRIWIEPHQKGPEDAPMLDGAKVYRLRRLIPNNRLGATTGETAKVRPAGLSVEHDEGDVAVAVDDQLASPKKFRSPLR